MHFLQQYSSKFSVITLVAAAQVAQLAILLQLAASLSFNLLFIVSDAIVVISGVDVLLDDFPPWRFYRPVTALGADKIKAQFCPIADALPSV